MTEHDSSRALRNDEFSVSVSVHEGSTLIRPVGDIDLASEAQMLEAIAHAAHSGARRYWIDLAAVPFMDSTGLRILITLIQEHGAASVTLAEPCDTVRKVLEVTGVDRYVSTI